MTKVRYFAVDAGGQLRKMRQAAVRGLWEGKARAHALGCPADAELRLVSVVCDVYLLPRKVYLLRLPLAGGRFTEEGLLALRAFALPDCAMPEESGGHHAEGWPDDFLPQLAVALDVTLWDLQVPLKVGGPLLLAAALRVTPRQALRYFR